MHVPWCLTVAHLPEAVNTCRPLGMFPCGLPRIPTRAIAPDTCAAPSSDFCAVRGSVRERAHLERHAPQRWTVHGVYYDSACADCCHSCPEVSTEPYDPLCLCMPSRWWA